MDERLKAALDELEEAEERMIASGADEDDEFYTAACELVAVWRSVKNPKTEKTAPIQTGLKFSLMPDGSTKIRSI